VANKSTCQKLLKGFQKLGRFLVCEAKHGSHVSTWVAPFALRPSFLHGLVEQMEWERVKPCDRCGVSLVELERLREKFRKGPKGAHSGEVPPAGGETQEGTK